MIFNMSTSGASTAENIKYDNTESGLQSTDVQGAVDELKSSLGDISNIGNETYNSVEKLLQYYIDNGYLPDINLFPLVPTMTSNTTPSGVCSASDEPNPAWYAFNSNKSGWSTNNNITNAWIQYKFERSCYVKKIEYDAYCYTAKRCKEFEILASNNGVDWTSLYSGVDENSSKSDPKTLNINSNTSYMYYRFHIKSSYSNSIGLKSLQFYGKFI